MVARLAQLIEVRDHERALRPWIAVADTLSGFPIEIAVAIAVVGIDVETPLWRLGVRWHAESLRVAYRHQ
jgi:hypothetical protein